MFPSSWSNVSWIYNRTRNVRITQYRGAILQPLLQWRRKCFLFRVCVCSLRDPACNENKPYCHLWPVRLYNIFPYYFIKDMIFEKKSFKQKMPVLIFYTTFVRNVTYSKKNWTGYDQNLHCFSYKVPVIVVRFSWNLNFLDRFSRNTQISDLMKIRPVSAELFHADGRTDMTMLIVAFRNFANAPKNWSAVSKAR
jgi:hypothetical protein